MSDNAKRSPALTAFIATTSALVLVAVSLIAGRMSAPTSESPGPASAEAGFARDMQVHHEQAVEMSLMIRDRTADPEIRLLAYDIATTQAQQAGQMFGWLATWGLSQSSREPPMNWMHSPTLGATDAHSHNGPALVDDSESVPAMPGTATRAQLAQLDGLSGLDAELHFLALMVAHHKGGIEMAEAVLDRSTLPVVTDLAGSMVIAQQTEIQLMHDLVAARATATSEGRP